VRLATRALSRTASNRTGGPAATDFTCGPRSHDGHKGTDIALPGLPAMLTGVDVLAATSGTVPGTRGGIPDIAQGTENAPETTTKSAG